MHREREHVLIPGRPYDRRAFTLIELLIVIALIAVLIAILVPALNRARKQALQVKCAANLRAIGQGVLYYAQDNRDLHRIYGSNRVRIGRVPPPWGRA